MCVVQLVVGCRVVIKNQSSNASAKNVRISIFSMSVESLCEQGISTYSTFECQWG